MRPAVARLLPLILALSIAVGPLASAIHAESHLIRSAPIGYQPHDEAAHGSHRAAEAHVECALCAQLKSVHALVSVGPDVAFRAPPVWSCSIACAHPQRAPFLALPTPRGPPIAS